MEAARRFGLRTTQVEADVGKGEFSVPAPEKLPKENTTEPSPKLWPKGHPYEGFKMPSRRVAISIVSDAPKPKPKPRS